MSILEEIDEFVKSMPMDYEFLTRWFKTKLSQEYNRSMDSYIPSDYCYNRKNNGIDYKKQTHYFLYIARGIYKYVGENYFYDGIIEHNPRKKK